MHVRVDDAGNDERVARVMTARDRWHVIECGDALDAAACDVNGCGPFSLWRDDTPAANDCQAVSAQNLRRRFTETRKR